MITDWQTPPRADRYEPDVREAPDGTLLVDGEPHDPDLHRLADDGGPAPEPDECHVVNPADPDPVGDGGEGEGDEYSMTAAEWHDCGYADGLYPTPATRRLMPTDPDRKAAYADGLAVGERDRKDQDERLANAPPLSEADRDCIPF